MYFVSITSQGQISIPAKIRRELGLAKKGRASVTVEDGKIIIKPVKDLLELAGSLSAYKKKPLTNDQLHSIVGDAIAEEYAESLKKDEMKVIVVDTNAFLRLFLHDIPEQKETVEKLLKDAEKKTHKLIVPQIVIFEIFYSLEKYYHVPKDEIVTNLTSLVSNKHLHIQNNTIFQKALKLFSSHNISLPDAFLAITTKEKDAELFTFDQKLKKLW